jgi:hypothetical protein
MKIVANMIAGLIAVASAQTAVPTSTGATTNTTNVYVESLPQTKDLI